MLSTDSSNLSFVEILRWYVSSIYGSHYRWIHVMTNVDTKMIDNSVNNINMLLTEFSRKQTIKWSTTSDDIPEFSPNVRNVKCRQQSDRQQGKQDHAMSVWPQRNMRGHTQRRVTLIVVTTLIPGILCVSFSFWFLWATSSRRGRYRKSLSDDRRSWLRLYLSQVYN